MSAANNFGSFMNSLAFFGVAFRIGSKALPRTQMEKLAKTLKEARKACGKAKQLQLDVAAFEASFVRLDDQRRILYIKTYSMTYLVLSVDYRFILTYEIYEAACEANRLKQDIMSAIRQKESGVDAHIGEAV
ncbi:uncharacterized protein STEHIDRAFT_120906 [Stereum hirsutum FP-91666 SS1]|uniref:uncharacterized protein n=1 Tax=Stereum hirsutum (strain FP-91666) TaxID=721885 RepID=UPI000440D871|nr:uncharacterized protein STEHIDRAFT_120906 [Stereum hirsutum FP-91666 SS1]EIM87205.1 hypothetical protein STEHIDRAFT_120906 [Stereum hirsutum FP-91666 SS1]